MKKFKISKVWGVFLSLAIVLTSTIQISSAQENPSTFDIDSTVVYGENSNDAIISLDISSIEAKYKVEEVKDPDGNTMDLVNLDYKVTTNGVYNFEVSYIELSKINGDSGNPVISELRTFVKTVEVKDIEQTEDVKIETTARSSLTRSSKNTVVDIPNFRILNNDGTEVTNTTEIKGVVGVEIDWKLTAEYGQVFSGGDVVEFAFMVVDSKYGSYFSVPTISSSDVKDSNGKPIGEVTASGRKITFKLNSNCEGSTVVSGKVKFPAIFTPQRNVNFEEITKVTIGNKEKNILWPGVRWPLAGNNAHYFTVGETSNNNITWSSNFGEKNLFELGQFKSVNPMRNVVVEQKLEGTYKGLNIHGIITHPATDDQNKPSQAYVYGPVVNDKFEKVEPKENEKYDAFKMRVSTGELKYGVFDNKDGSVYVLVNMGDIPNQKVKFSDFYKESTPYDYLSKTLGNYAIPASSKQYYNDNYGINSPTNSSFCMFAINIVMQYETVLLSENKNGSSVVKYNGNAEVKFNRVGTLKGILANGSLGHAKSVQLYKTDVDTNDFLSGASFKLQRQNGGTWSDYTAGDGGKSTRTTDESGRVMFSNLAAGTYKFVEETAATGYNKDTVIYNYPTFTVTDDEKEGRLILAKNKKFAMTVSANPITKYVGDTLTLPEGVSANNYKSIPISVNGSNTVSKHGIPNANGKYTTPGTYEVEHVVTDTATGQTGKVIQKVKINGLPSMNATPQEYFITDTSINAKVQANPKAEYGVASDTVGGKTTSTNIANNKIKYNIISGPVTTGFTATGIYNVKYTATNPDGKQVSTTTQVLIKSKGMVGTDVYINASDFVAGIYKRAAALTAEQVKNENYGKAVAFAKTYNGSNQHIGYEAIPVASIVVDNNQLNVIKSSDAKGGRFHLTYSVVKNGKSATKTVNVAVLSTPTDNWDGELGLGASGFTVNYEDANKLTASKVKANSDVSAIKQDVDVYGNKTVIDVTGSVKVNDAQLEAIKNAPVTGGIYDLTYVVTTPVNGVDKTKSKTVVVTVLPKDAITKDDLSIGANGFILENIEAKNLTIDNAKNANRGNSSAYYAIRDAEGFIVNAKNVSGQIVVSADQVKVINKTTKFGGIYPLNYSVTENGITVSKTVLVLVRPEFGPTPVDEFNLPIAAEGFAIAYPEAKPLTDDQAKDHANATAYYGKLNEVGKVIDAKDVSHNIAANQQHMSMIQNTPITGGTHNLQFTVSEEGLSSTVTVPVLVRPKYDVIDKEEDPDISLGAFNFELENEEAATLDVKDAVLPYRGNAVAYKIIYNDKNEMSSFVSITDKITVNKDEIKVINEAPREGGVYPLTYYVEDNGIKVQKTVQVLVKPVTAEGEKDLPLAAWDFAVDYDGLEAFDNAVALTNGNAMATYIVRDEDGIAVEYKDVSANITADQADMDTIKNAPVTGGIYDLTYTVTEGGLTSNKTVSVLVRPYKGEKDDEETLAIGAYDFVLDYEEAAPFTAEDALLEKHGNPVAYISNYNEFGEIESHAIITDKVVANEADIKNINNAPRNGGIYDLTYSVTDKVMIDGKEVEQTVSKTVKVLVNPVGGNKDKDDENGRQNVVIDGEGFTVSHKDAVKLNQKDAIKNADGIAYGITYDAKGLIDEMKNISGDITVDETQLKAINEAPVTGGIYDLTLTVTDGENTASVTVPVLVEGLDANRDDDQTISLAAFGFILENKEALAFTDADALLEKHGNPAAYRTDYNEFGEVTAHTVITDKVKAASEDIKKINDAPREGGIYDLRYYVTDTVTIDGEQKEVTVEKTVQVLVKPVVSAGDKNVTISAEGFILENVEAQVLTDEESLVNGKAIAYGVTYTDYGTVASIKDISDDITVDQEHRKVINDTTSKGGIYDLAFSVSDGKNTATIEVPVLVKPLFFEKDDETGIIIGAEGFEIENAQAATLDDETSIEKGNAVAYKVIKDADGYIIGFIEISSELLVDQAQLAEIKKAPTNGGIYDLTYFVTEIIKIDGEEVEQTVSKTVKVVVKGINTPPMVVTPDGDALAITANDFTIENHEAAELNDVKSIDLANAEAWLVSTSELVLVSPNMDMLNKIKQAPKQGGVYDLTFTANVLNSDQSITINEVTIKVTVLPIDLNNIGGADTGDTTDVTMLLLLALASLVVIKRRKVFTV